MFVFCLCVCLGYACVCVRVWLNACCVNLDVRAERSFMFGERCLARALIINSPERSIDVCFV